MDRPPPVKRESALSHRRFAFELLHTEGPANNMPVFHWHEFMELSYVRRGHGTYEIEDKRFPVARGDIVVINNIERHRVTYEPDDPLFETVMHFSPQLLSPREHEGLDASYLGLFAREGTAFANTPLLSEPARRRVSSLVAAISGEYRSRRPWYELMIKSQLLTLVALLLRESGKCAAASPGQVARRKSNIARLESVLAYLRESFATELRLGQVASRFCMSPAYFSDYFRKNLGITFSEYLLRLRVSEAARRLSAEAGERPKVLDVAFACGFNSAASFYRAFRALTGTTPREHEAAEAERGTLSAGVPRALGGANPKP